MRAFRIENEKHEGICVAPTGICDRYHTACGLPLGCKKHSRFDSFDADICLDFCGWKCAFTSKAVLLSWFPELTGREAMKALGARVVELELLGDTYTTTDGEQIIFDPHDVDYIAVYDITTLEA